MGLNISLFVHGVPMGQKIWGPKGGDQRYLSSFYGPKWDTPEVMKVEIMTFGGLTSCYYSFIKGQNVCDSQGRAGSYFALTLRINAFYVDVQNMYNILKAAYEKMCVGLCVQDTGTMVKYLVADFQSIDSKLKDIESHILNYIGEFSVNEDIVSLSGFSANSQGACQNVNLHECTKRLALDYVKKAGKMMVSPCFLSVSAAKEVDKYKTEMETVRQKAQQEIQLQQRTSQEQITAITQKSQADIQSVTRQAEENLRLSEQRSQQQIAQANADNERKMSELKQRYSQVDEKIDTLNRTNRGLESEVSDWKKQCKQKDEELLTSNAKIQKLQESVEKLQRDFSAFKDGGVNLPKPLTIGNKPLVIVSLAVFFVILLIALLIYLQMGKWGNKESEIESLQKKIELLEKENKRLEKENKRSENTLKTATTKASKALVISIKEEGKEVNKVECGHIYVVSLVGNGSDTLQGAKFESAAFETQAQNHIMPKRDSVGKTCTIRYVYNGKTMAKKSVKIEKD